MYFLCIVNKTSVLYGIPFICLISMMHTTYNLQKELNKKPTPSLFKLFKVPMNGTNINFFFKYQLSCQNFAKYGNQLPPQEVRGIVKHHKSIAVQSFSLIYM